MAKPSSNATPAFKAIPYRAPAPAPGARRAAAANDNYPVPVYLVMRTDWRFSKRSGRHQQQTTTVVSAFTTLLPAHEAALIAFEKFVAEYHYAGERSVENRLSWYSWWNGRNKAHFRDVKEIAEDMKTWPAKWKGGTAEERYEKMVEAMEAVKARLPNGSIFNVEKSSLPPSARARAVNALTPVPFKVFVLTENHWSWSKPVDVTTVLGIFTCFAQARAAGVDAYHTYIHSSHQERKRLKWDKTSASAYDKMLKNVLADKVTWEKTTREYGTSFSIDECYLYPRGAYFRHQDEVLPKAEDLILPRAGADSSMRGAYPAPAPAAAAHGEQLLFSSSSTAAVNCDQIRAGENGPKAHGFIRRTYAVNPEKKQKEDRVGAQSSESGGAAAAQKNVFQLHGRGYGEQVKEGAALPEARGSGGVTRGGQRVTFEDEGREGHGEFQGDEDGGWKKRKTWRSWMPQKEDDLVGVGGRGGGRGRQAQDRDLEREERDLRENFERREPVHQDEDGIPEKEEFVYHRAYAYVASDKRQNEVCSEQEDVHTSTPAYTGADEQSLEGAEDDLEDFVESEGHFDDVRRWVNDQAKVLFEGEGYEDECDDDQRRDPLTSEKSGPNDEEVLSNVDDRNGYPFTSENDYDGEILPEGDDYQVDELLQMEKSQGEDDEVLSEVDDEHEYPFSREGFESEGLPEGGDEQLNEPAANEKEDEEVCVAEVDEHLDFPFTSESCEDEGLVVDDGDQLEDPLRFKTAGQDEERNSNHVDGKCERHLTGEGCDDEIGEEGDGDQFEVPASVWKSGEYEEVPSKEVHDQLKRSCRNVVYDDEDFPGRCDKQREYRLPRKKAAGEYKKVLPGQVEDRVEYYFTSEGYESVIYAEDDDPPLIRKSAKGKEVPSQNVDDQRKGKAIKREHHQNETFAECEEDQLEDSFPIAGCQEDIVGRRKEAPHLDLVLKRHRNHAFLKADDESSEDDFVGRPPVGGGFKIPS